MKDSALPARDVAPPAASTRKRERADIRWSPRAAGLALAAALFVAGGCGQESVKPPDQQPKESGQEPVKLSELAAKRAARIRPGSFELSLVYFGPSMGLSSSSYINIRMYDGPSREGPPSPPISLRPDKQQVESIVKFLAEDGFLDRAGSLRGGDTTDRHTEVSGELQCPRYEMKVRCGEETLVENLGWGTPMMERLERFRKVLTGDVGSAADTLLDRLELRRKDWSLEATAQTPQRIDWEKAAAYTCGPWAYRYECSRDRKGAAVGKQGLLSHRGRELRAPDINDRIETPWGILYYVGMQGSRNGPRGWLPDPGKENAEKGHLLPTPMDALRFEELAKNDALAVRLYPERTSRAPCKGLWFWNGDWKRPPKQPDTLDAKLTDAEMRALLKRLAYAGCLGRAGSLGGSGWLYSLYIYGGKKTMYVLDLGWAPKMLRDLATIRNGLTGDAARNVDEVLSALDGLRKDCEKALASPPTTLEEVRAVLDELMLVHLAISKYEPPVGPVAEGNSYAILPGPLDGQGKARVEEYCKVARGRMGGRLEVLGASDHVTVLFVPERSDEMISEAVMQILKLKAQKRDP